MPVNVNPARLGTTWYTGTTPPDNALGRDGDFYLDSITGNVWVKAAAQWGAPVGCMLGPPGGLVDPAVTSSVFEEFIWHPDTPPVASGAILRSAQFVWWAVGVWSAPATSTGGTWRLLANGNNIPALCEGTGPTTRHSYLLATKQPHQRFRLRLVNPDPPRIQRWGMTAQNGLFQGDQNGAYIRCVEGTGNFIGVTRVGGNETARDLGVPVDTAFHDFQIRFCGEDGAGPGTEVEFYIDGVERAASVTTIPAGMMAQAFGRSAANGTGGFEIDYLRIDQER